MSMYSRVPPIPTTNINVDNNSASSAENNFVTNESNCQKPKHIRQDLWKKFKDLEKRTDEVTRRSTEKRIKHLQRDVMQKIQEEITTDEDRDILREHDVKFGPPVAEPSKSHKRTHPDSKKSDDENENKWKTVQGFLTVNDHLKGTDPEKYAPKSQLEKHIDQSIKDGDFDSAEKLSDQLATREFGKKIADAFDAKKYSTKLKEQKDSIKEKKKKKLAWGFEHKQRWETKSAM